MMSKRLFILQPGVETRALHGRKKSTDNGLAEFDRQAAMRGIRTPRRKEPDFRPFEERAVSKELRFSNIHHDIIILRIKSDIIADGRTFTPFLFGNLPRLIEHHFPVDDCAEQRLAFVRVDGYEIAARRGVISPLQSDVLTVL